MADLLGNPKRITFPRQRLQVQRHIAALEQLEELLTIVESLPRSASCSLILSYTPDTQKPVVMVYAVVPVEEISAIASLSQLPSIWRAEVEGLEVFCCDRKTTELSPPVIFES